MERSSSDDLQLRERIHERDDEREREADEWAQEALIPSEIWNQHPAQDNPTVRNVLSLARKADVHPAIVAGRIRRRVAQLPASVAVRWRKRGGSAAKSMNHRSMTYDSYPNVRTGPFWTAGSEWPVPQLLQDDPNSVGMNVATRRKIRPAPSHSHRNCPGRASRTVPHRVSLPVPSDGALTGRLATGSR